MSPTIADQPNEASQATQQPAADHDQNHESLNENNNGSKQKRKAPVVLTTNTTQEATIASGTAEEFLFCWSSWNLSTLDGEPSSTVTTTVERAIVSTTVESVGDQATTSNSQAENIHIVMDAADRQRLVNLLAEQRTPPQARLVITTSSSEPANRQSQSSTPIYSQIQKTKEHVQNESPYSIVKQSPAPSPTLPQPEEPVSLQDTKYSVAEIVQAGIAEPPPPSPPPAAVPEKPVVVEKPAKASKRSTSTDGLLKIVTDHQNRADVYQANEKQAENVSYFRVAKSRHGKFETENQGFVNNATVIFNANQQSASTTSKSSESISRPAQTSKPVPVSVQTQSKGKQAYDLLKKYEKEDDDEQHALSPLHIDTDYLKTQPLAVVAEKDKPTTPIQVGDLSPTSRAFHLSHARFLF